MKRIAMLNCLKANEVCAGAACLAAWNSKTKTFAAYEGEEVELVAFMRCNGCGADPREDKGVQEKIERLCKIGVDAVHMGVCTKSRGGTRCKTIEAIAGQLAERGVILVDGTH